MREGEKGSRQVAYRPLAVARGNRATRSRPVAVLSNSNGCAVRVRAVGYVRDAAALHGETPPAHVSHVHGRVHRARVRESSSDSCRGTWY